MRGGGAPAGTGENQEEGGAVVKEGALREKRSRGEEKGRKKKIADRRMLSGKDKKGPVTTKKDPSPQESRSMNLKEKRV